MIRKYIYIIIANYINNIIEIYYCYYCNCYYYKFYYFIVHRIMINGRKRYQYQM